MPSNFLSGVEFNAEPPGLYTPKVPLTSPTGKCLILLSHHIFPARPPYYYVEHILLFQIFFSRSIPLLLYKSIAGLFIFASPFNRSTKSALNFKVLISPGPSKETQLIIFASTTGISSNPEIPSSFYLCFVINKNIDQRRTIICNLLGSGTSLVSFQNTASSILPGESGKYSFKIFHLLR